MSDIGNFLKRLAGWDTLDEAVAKATDDDEARTIYEEYKQPLDDDVAGLIMEARKLWPKYEEGKYSQIDLSGAAIREHFENHDETEKIEGLTDEDLDEAGEWALNCGFMWDSVYAAWEYGVEMVRNEKDEKEN